MSEPNLLFIDTETTGMWNWKERDELHESQPDIIQLAAMLTDPMGKVIQVYSTLVIPEKPIEAEAQGIHGISLEKCQKEGLTVAVAIDMVDDLWQRAQMIVAHNKNFDLPVMRRGYRQAKRPYPELASYCTMVNATKPCGLRNSRNGPKWPKLTEAVKILLRRDFTNAHNAIADVEACRLLYLHLRGLPVTESPYSELVGPVLPAESDSGLFAFGAPGPVSP